MDKTDKLREKLALPAVSHIGVVVKDVNEAVEYYSSLFGIGPFTTYEFIPRKYWLRGEPCYVKYNMGKANWGDIVFELIQPLEGKSLHHEFLEAYGEGLHHLGFDIPNYDEVFDKFMESGFEPLMVCEAYLEAYRGDIKGCYFDTQSVGGVIFEIVWRSWLAD